MKVDLEVRFTLTEGEIQLVGRDLTAVGAYGLLSSLREALAPQVPDRTGNGQ